MARGRTLARANAWVIAVLALVTSLACRPKTPPPFTGDPGDIDAPIVDDALQADWDALQGARVRDPADPDVTRRAEALIQRDPPLGVYVGALLAKAEQSYLTAADDQAIEAADQALRVLAPIPEPAPAVAVALAVVRLRALVRSGDAALAVQALADPRIQRDAGLDEAELAGLDAVAHDRHGDAVLAAVGYARWRAAVGDGQAAAVYAEQRLGALIDMADADALRDAVLALPGGAARQCLAFGIGLASEAEAIAAPWVHRCHGTAAPIGVLLPRTGRLAALSDVQLAAASVAVPLLGERARLVFRDAGSTPDEAAAGAAALAAEGVRTIVGPVGAANIEAAARAVPPSVALVVPGEGERGVAPSLEQRVAALVTRARALGVSRFVVAAPDNAYGRRAAEAIRAKLSDAERARLVEQRYPAETTSFTPVLTPILDAVRKGTVVLVPDHVSRVELFVRQLTRLGKPLAAAPSDDGTLVMSTAEGVSEAALGRGHEVLDGMWVAPVAAPSEAALAFVDAYRTAQGEAPNDQALLVWFALRRASAGEPGPRAQALLVRGGRLVASETESRAP